MRIYASRQCADYAHTSYASAGEARGQMLRSLYIYMEFVVSIIDAPTMPSSPTSISIAKELRQHISWS